MSSKNNKMPMLEYRLDVMNALAEIGYIKEILISEKLLTEKEIKAIKAYKPVSMRTLSKICGILDRDIDEVVGMPNRDYRKGNHIMADWVPEQLSEHPKANPFVLEFIQEAITRIPGKEHTILEFFTQGYCYYFALMLQHNFGGTLCIPGFKNHVVWLDGTDPDTDIAYDAYGVYTDYNPRNLDECLIPIEFFGPLYYGLLHIPAISTITTNSDDITSIKEWYSEYRRKMHPNVTGVFRGTVAGSRWKDILAVEDDTDLNP